MADEVGRRFQEHRADEAEASLIASNVLSVIRDKSISSSYGLYLHLLQEESGDFGVPPIEDIFTPRISEKLKKDISAMIGDGALELPLYSGEGDLFGQLFRLLMICNEVLQEKMSDKIDEVDKEVILFDERNVVLNGKCIKHLRNAVFHNRFNVIVNKDDPFRSVFYFWDINAYGNKEINAELYFDADSLNQTIDMLINDICLPYLSEIGWIFK